MSTFAMQCLLAHLLEGGREAEMPEHWRHGRDGSLTYRFSGSDNRYTWDADAVAETTPRWHELRAARPDSVAPFLEAHERLLAAVREARGPLPDAVYHDLEAGEVTAVWEDRKQIVVVDGVGGRVGASSAS